MKELSLEKKDEIIKVLQERGARLPCPRCGGDKFTLLDGYFSPFIHADIENMAIGGPSVPCAVVACKNCGYLSQHALGALGLLTKEETKK